MNRRQIGNSDLRVSSVCLGTWQFNAEQSNEQSLSTWRAQKIETSKAIFNKAIEVGINFFDTAEGYKNSEYVLGQCLSGGTKRQDVVIASKFGYCKAAGEPLEYNATDIEKHVEQSLRHLQTDYLDLYQVHWPVVMKDVGETVLELKRLQSLGKIRYYGICNSGLTNIQQFIEAGGKPITNQLPYNLLWRGIEEEILPCCEKYEMNVLAYSPLQQGLLTGKFRRVEDVPEGRRRTRHFNKESTTLSRHGEEGAEEETFKTIERLSEICKKYNVSLSAASISWLLSKNRVTSTIVGATSVEQVIENVKVIDLEQEVIDELSECSEGLRIRFGKNVDMWAPVSRVT